MGELSAGVLCAAMTAGGAAGGGALPALSLRRLQIDPDTGIPSPTAAESTTRRNPRNVVTVRARRVLVVALALWTCTLLGDLVKSVSVRYQDKRLDDSEEEVDTEAAVGAATEAEGTRPRSSRPSISERIRERRAVEWAKAMRRVETGHAHKFWVKQAAEVRKALAPIRLLLSHNTTHTTHTTHTRARVGPRILSG